MAYEIKILDEANFDDLDNDVKIKIQKFLDRKELIINPRSFGEPLKYQLYGLWRYRVGQWRINQKSKTMF
jgi:mRNA-degrading endonuclease RelE of RelBE toxin-antitoxin system